MDTKEERFEESGSIRAMDISQAVKNFIGRNNKKCRDNKTHGKGKDSHTNHQKAKPDIPGSHYERRYKSITPIYNAKKDTTK